MHFLMLESLLWLEKLQALHTAQAHQITLLMIWQLVFFKLDGYWSVFSILGTNASTSKEWTPSGTTGVVPAHRGEKDIPVHSCVHCKSTWLKPRYKITHLIPINREVTWNKFISNSNFISPDKNFLHGITASSRGLLKIWYSVIAFDKFTLPEG